MNSAVAIMQAAVVVRAVMKERMAIGRASRRE